MEKLQSTWKSGDVYGHAGYPLFPEQYNLMVDIVKLPADGKPPVIEVKMLVPQYASSMDLASGIKPDQGVHALGDRVYTVLWQNHRHSPKIGTCFLFGVTEQFPKVDADWIFGEDAACLPTYETVHAEQSFGSSRPLRMLELFSGGFGGWSSGLGFISQFLSYPVRCVGIDSCWDAVTQYAVTHTANIINGFQDFPVTLLDQHAHTIIWADIDSESFFGFPAWIQQMMHWAPDYLCFSSPCPPWSSAGRLSGLSTAEGMLFPKALSICRMLRPRLVGIEQVAGFPSHPESKLLIDLLRSSGYQIIWQGVIDAGQFGSSNRQRLLCLACLQFSDDLEPAIHQEWVKKHGVTPLSMDAILSWDHSTFQELVVSDEVLAMASAFKFLPNSGRFRIFNNRQAVLNSRCNDGSSPNRTFMAMYGSQHEIDRRHLKEKKLLVHFARLPTENNVIRYWHPLEIMLQHVTTHRLFAPKPLKAGWKTSGNMLAQPHALFVHVNGLMKVTNPKLKMKPIFGDLWASKLNAGNTVKDILPNGAFLSHVFDAEMNDLKEVFVQLIDFTEAFPAASFWEARTGFQPFPQPPTEAIASVVSTDASEDIPATVPFRVLQTGHIVQSGGIFSFLAAMDLPKTDVENLWLDHFTCEFLSTDETSETGCALRLTPRISFADDEIPGPVVVIAINGEMTILPFPDDRNLINLLQAYHVEGDFEDQFGPPSNNHFGKAPLFTPVCAHVSRDLLSPAFVLAASQTCTQTFRWNHETMEFHIQGSGPETDCATMALFWRDLIADAKLAHLGLSSSCQWNHDSFQVFFGSSTRKSPIPPGHFWMLLSVECFRYLFRDFHCQDGQPVKIKLRSCVLWEGRIAPDVTLQQLHGILKPSIVAYSPADPRVLCRGKTLWHYPATLAEIARDEGAETLTLHIMHSLHGGGVKENNRQQAKNSLASTLLENGFDLKWVSTTADVLVTRASQTEVTRAAQLTTSAERMKAIMKLCHDCGIDTDVATKKSYQMQNKAHQNKTKRMTQVQPEPTEYQLEAGFLKNQDKTEVQQIQQVSARASGLCLVNSQQAIPWLREGCTLSKDELGLLILSPQLPCPTKLKHQQDWEQILKNTNAFLRNALGDQRSYDAITSIWGKSFRRKNKAVGPHDAESVQVHGSVLETSLHALLAASGFNSIYATPKTAEGRIDDENWKVIWVEGSFQHVTSMANSSPSCQGLIRGKRTFGLRFSATNYADAWIHLHPGVPKPFQNGGSQVYRLQPLPFGCTNEAIAQWANSVGWTIKPLKSLGPRAYLIATNQPPPDGVLVFNGSPIIAQFLPPRNTVGNHPTILAGPKPQRQVQVDGMLKDDPWAPFFSRQADAASLPSKGPVAAPRSVAGPTEQKFQHTETRLHALETSLQELKQVQQEQAASNQAFQTATQQAVKATEEGLKNYVASSIDQVRKDLDTSLKHAMETPTKQINANLADLKELFKAHSKRGLEKSENEDMEDDEG
eukprot:Skav234398  [mRNA]  locus=scaffold873:183676:188215:- [translate_table: standard]